MQNPPSLHRSRVVTDDDSCGNYQTVTVTVVTGFTSGHTSCGNYHIRGIHHCFSSVFPLLFMDHAGCASACTAVRVWTSSPIRSHTRPVTRPSPALAHRPYGLRPPLTHFLSRTLVCPADPTLSSHSLHSDATLYTCACPPASPFPRGPSPTHRATLRSPAPAKARTTVEYADLATSSADLRGAASNLENLKAVSYGVAT